MMRPHTAHEETEVLPEYRKLMSKKEYRAVCETIDKQRRKFLDNVDFEEWAVRVAQLEALLGPDVARWSAKGDD